MKMIQFLNECTTLDFATEPIYSGLLLFALFAEKGEEPTITGMLAGGTEDPLAKAMSLLVSGERLGEVREIDFGSKFPAAGVAVLNLLRVMQTPEMI
jgi:hypothetical protein